MNLRYTLDLLELLTDSGNEDDDALAGAIAWSLLLLAGGISELAVVDLSAG